MEAQTVEHPDDLNDEWCRGEIRELSHIGIPAGLTFLATAGMSFSSMAILGHIGTKYLAAAATATVWMEVTSNILAGFGSGMTTLAAQALGAKNYKLVGLYVQLSIFWTTMFNIPLICIWMFTEPVLKFINVDPEEAELAGQYAMWSSMRLIPFTIFLLMQCYLQVLRVTTPTMVVSFIGLGLNVGLNLLFVHGAGSWDGLGYVGAPISTAITRIIMIVLLYLYAFYWKQYHRSTWGEGRNLREALGHGRSYRYLVTQVLPLSLGLCLEEWQLQVVTIFAAQLGTVQVATHNAILSCFFVLTSFMYGTTAAVRVRLAHYLGANAPNRSKRVGVYGLAAATLFGVGVSIFLIFTRGFLSKVFSNDPAVWKEAKSVQIIVGLSYFAISIFYISMATLDGQGRPIPVAVAFLIGAWGVGVPLAYVFAFPLKQDLLGLWYGLVTGYVVVTLMVVVVVLRSDWAALAERARQRAEKAQMQTETDGDQSQLEAIEFDGGLRDASSPIANERDLLLHVDPMSKNAYGTSDRDSLGSPSSSLSVSVVTPTSDTVTTETPICIADDDVSEPPSSVESSRQAIVSARHTDSEAAIE